MNDGWLTHEPWSAGRSCCGTWARAWAPISFPTRSSRTSIGAASKCSPTPPPRSPTHTHAHTHTHTHTRTHIHTQTHTHTHTQTHTYTHTHTHTHTHTRTLILTLTLTLKQATVHRRQGLLPSPTRFYHVLIDLSCSIRKMAPR